MRLPYGIKEIICPIISKPTREYSISCPLHFFAVPDFNQILLESGYENISSDDIYFNRESMDFIYIDMEGNKRSYLLEVFTSLEYAKLEQLFSRAIVKEFKNKYVLVQGMSDRVHNRLNTQSFNEIKSTLSTDMILLLEKSLGQFVELSSKYSNMNISSTLGILLYGEPGVGKTFALRSYLGHLMSEQNFTIVQLYQDSLEYINIAELLESSQYLFPCVIFIEDIDIKFKDRKEFGLNLSGQLLETFEGLSKAQNVALIATSNSTDVIERALLRPGRIDYVFKVDKPTREVKEKIVANYIKDLDFKFPDELKDILIKDCETIAELSGAFKHIVRNYLFENIFPTNEEIASISSKWKNARIKGIPIDNHSKVGIL